MKIVVAPDTFKGSLPAMQVAAAIAAGLRVGLPGAELVAGARRGRGRRRGLRRPGRARRDQAGDPGMNHIPGDEAGR
jgi:hypothetical protein